MVVALTNLTRSFRFLGTTQLLYLGIDVTQFASNQKTLPGTGLTDIVQGLLLEPVSAKYPNWGFLRWVDGSGRVVGTELPLDFKQTDLFPEYGGTAGFELYVRPGTIFNVTISNGGGSVNFEDYYTKAEVTALLANYPLASTVFTQSQVNSLLAGKQNAGSYYTQAQVNALIAAVPTGFKYVGNTIPSSPSNGDLWLEQYVDGSYDVLWSWNATVSRWQRLDRLSVGCSANNIAVTTAIPFTGDVRQAFRETRLYDWTATHFVSGTNNNTNYWTSTLVLLGSSTNLATLMTTRNRAASTNLVDNQGLNIVRGTGATAAFSIIHTKVGTPGNLFASHTLHLVQER